MSVHGGGFHVVCLSEGKLYAFGSNISCQISPSKKKKFGVPVEIEIPSNLRIISFYSGVGSNQTVVLTSGGLYARGQRCDGVFGDGNSVIPKAWKRMKVIEFYKNKQPKNYWVEGDALWVLLENGKLFRSGRNHCGQLSNSTFQQISIPQELDRSFLSSSKEQVVDIKGSTHTLLLTRCYPATNRGMVYVAGGDRSGHNNTECVSVPTVIAALKGKMIKKICCGRIHSMFLTEENTVFGCGGNYNYQTGLGTRDHVHVPTLVSTKFQTIDIAATLHSTVFLTNLGDVHSVGANDDGQGGIGNLHSPIICLTKAKIKMTLEADKGKVIFAQKPERLVDVRVVTW